MNREQMIDHLERIVDGSSLEMVLSALAEVCALKSQHLLENWNDKGQSLWWDRAAKFIDTAWKKLFVPLESKEV